MEKISFFFQQTNLYANLITIYALYHSFMVEVLLNRKLWKIVNALTNRDKKTCIEIKRTILSGLK